MCDFISDYEDSKLFKRRMNKLADEESRRATPSGFKVRKITTKNALSETYFFSWPLYFRHYQFD
jgi:hypothetical protein